MIRTRNIIGSCQQVVMVDDDDVVMINKNKDGMGRRIVEKDQLGREYRV